MDFRQLPEMQLRALAHNRAKVRKKTDIMKFYLYSAPQKKRALPGTDEPASERVPEVMRSLIHEGSRFPRPTSISEPTMARTMLRRKRFALIVNTM